MAGGLVRLTFGVFDGTEMLGMTSYKFMSIDWFYVQTFMLLSQFLSRHNTTGDDVGLELWSFL